MKGVIYFFLLHFNKWPQTNPSKFFVYTFYTKPLMSNQFPKNILYNTKTNAYCCYGKLYYVKLNEQNIITC